MIVDQHVFEFQVSVDHVLLMAVLQSCSDLGDDSAGQFFFDFPLRLLLYELPKRQIWNKLHD